MLYVYNYIIICLHTTYTLNWRCTIATRIQAPEIVGHRHLMFVYFRIFIWLLCMELQWGCQTNRRNSYSKHDLKNVHMGPSSGAVIEAMGSMHVCREHVSTVQKNSLHRASFRHPPPLPILYNSIFDMFLKLSLRPDLKNVHTACYLINQYSKSEGPTMIFKMYKVLLKNCPW